ncbi:hypothetical protein AQJ84_05480 [Streptomyces resistomycificus]|uniref:Uncharacterized protein n=1 Tax=Streptomyces resistomycificus TaxID=67356 RepID=A0A0L8L184_9ACTN|nr:hypothetical protein ADK37_28925 [Streptomyces resistomycificus]KUO00467.1 hypothetical protein AQJ84_05480 [Streptomyces resistomycificus]
MRQGSGSAASGADIRIGYRPPSTAGGATGQDLPSGSVWDERRGVPVACGAHGKETRPSWGERA